MSASEGPTERERGCMSAVMELAALCATGLVNAEALLAQHVDDGRGKCRGCTLPQRGYRPWPCATYTAATIAAESAMRQAGVVP